MLDTIQNHETKKVDFNNTAIFPELGKAHSNIVMCRGNEGKDEDVEEVWWWDFSDVQVS